jgi:hypothetical protein
MESTWQQKNKPSLHQVQRQNKSFPAWDDPCSDKLNHSDASRVQESQESATPAQKLEQVLSKLDLLIQESAISAPKLEQVLSKLDKAVTQKVRETVVQPGSFPFPQTGHWSTQLESRVGYG